jgi:hypothetical protein
MPIDPNHSHPENSATPAPLLPLPAITKACRHCVRFVPASAQFCSFCGGALAESEDEEGPLNPPPASYSSYAGVAVAGVFIIGAHLAFGKAGMPLEIIFKPTLIAGFLLGGGVHLLTRQRNRGVCIAAGVILVILSTVIVGLYTLLFIFLSGFGRAMGTHAGS